MTNELGFSAPEASGAFRAAHDFAINNSTLNDVRGNYVRDHFVACVDIIVTDRYILRTATKLRDLHLYIEC